MNNEKNNISRVVNSCINDVNTKSIVEYLG